MGGSEVGCSSSNLWLAPDPSKRWGEIFFLLYTPFWLTLCLGIVVPYKLYENFTEWEYLTLGLISALPAFIIPMILVGKNLHRDPQQGDTGSTTSTGFLMLEPPPTQMPESTSVPEWTIRQAAVLLGESEEILETVRELPNVDPERAASIEGWRAFFLEHDVENPVDSVSTTFTQIIGGDISIELERY
ncbi:hypothetical protein CASFOL_018755 [Castilleja foliolosa]|uniref:Uncharacterized protein n=1 Tax=Castilleja foliolosa TaxID=1961234 RepID=A0ABD3D6H5_9LAMI